MPKKNVLIVNFNTQELTNACIKSVNLKVPGCSIYVFDNSDKTPFVNTFENVHVFDNTRGQIIDFQKWLESYPQNGKSREATKIHGSAKHCYTIEKCLSLLPDGFVLLDSDVLVKKDFSDIYDEQYMYVGETQKQNGVNVIRVLPFICYINSKMCLENNVHFFDGAKMLGLCGTISGEKYDTGAAFYLNTQKFPHKLIKYEDYIVHLKGGSWFEVHKNYTEKVRKIKITISPELFLSENRSLWDDAYQKQEPPKPAPEPEKPKPSPEEKIMPVVKKKEAEVKYLKMAKTSNRKIGVLNR